MYSDVEVSQGARDRLEADQECERFKDDARFVKIVTKPDGLDALLIGGQVIEVYPARFADLLSRALRSGATNGKGGLMAGTIQSGSQDSASG